MARRRRSSRIAVRRAVLAIGVVVLLLGRDVDSRRRLLDAPRGRDDDRRRRRWAGSASTTRRRRWHGGPPRSSAGRSRSSRAAAPSSSPRPSSACGRTGRAPCTAPQPPVTASRRSAASAGSRRSSSARTSRPRSPSTRRSSRTRSGASRRRSTAPPSTRPCAVAGSASRSHPTAPASRLDRARARALIVAALADLERRGPVRLPLVASQPEVTRAQLAKAAVVARTALSAPVTLTAGPTRFRLPRWKVAELLRLPGGGATEVAIAGPKADQWLASLARSIGRTPSNATFAAVPGGVEVVPARPGRALDVEASRAAVARAAFSPTARTAPLVVETAQPERSTAEAKAMGITGVVGSYTTTYGGTPGRVHNVQPRGGPDRRRADRAGRPVLVQRHDRRAQRGEGVRGGAGDHQRRAPDRDRRGRLPGLDDGLQRGLRGGPLDRSADEPRALHRPLPDSAGTRR